MPDCENNERDCIKQSFSTTTSPSSANDNHLVLEGLVVLYPPLRTHTSLTAIQQGIAALDAILLASSLNVLDVNVMTLVNHRYSLVKAARNLGGVKC